MLRISQEQISKRWDLLPLSLRESLYSFENGKIVWGIGVDNHLSEEKIGKIAGAAGYVILGFIHAEDLAKEIGENLGLNSEIAGSIAREIDRKIFGPIRNDLEKVYSMPAEEKEVEKETLDLRAKAQALEVSGIKPAETITTAAEAPKIIPPEEKPEAAKPLEISPAPAIQADGPMIIHKEAEFKPLSENRKSLGGLFGFLRKDKEQKPEIMTAAKVQVELGSQPLGVSEAGQQPEKPEPSKVAKTEMPKVRVVHYTEFPVATSPFPVEGEKPKEVIQPGSLRMEKQEIKPLENLPTNLPTEIKIPSPPEVVIEKKIMPEEKQPDKIVPTQPLDLRQASSGIKPVSAPEKLEKKEENKNKEEAEMIDLTTFKKI